MGSCGAALFAVAAGTAASLAIAGACRRELLCLAALSKWLCAPAPSAPMDHCSCLLVHLLCLAFPVAVSLTPPVVSNALPNVFEKIPWTIWLSFSTLACTLRKAFSISLYDTVFNCCPSKLNKGVLYNCWLQPQQGWLQHIAVGQTRTKGCTPYPGTARALIPAGIFPKHLLRVSLIVASKALQVFHIRINLN